MKAWVGILACCSVAAVPSAPFLVESPPSITVTSHPIIGYAVAWKGSIDIDYGGGNPGATLELSCRPSGGQWVQVQVQDLGAGIYLNHQVSGPYYSTTSVNWYRVRVTNSSGNPPLSSELTGTFTLP